MERTVQKYQELLQQIDRWFALSSERYPELIACQSGCSCCCRSLFDITMLDAYVLQCGFATLPAETRELVLAKCRARLELMREQWPEFRHPFVLNERLEEDWEALMPDEDETPCVLLDDNGRCLVYQNRPMTCRLHGLPLIDVTGEVLHDEWCTLNFTDSDPLELEGVRAPFDSMIRQEVALVRDFTQALLGQRISELDTFIPTALLVDFAGFNWHEWLRGFTPAAAETEEE
ncbi:hypothetical protein GMST_24160 [Geomonas silvestris]|uniref:Zinc/iron-chelating domain-containing protein n=1 Tax=Geomonas silvestris TaxID=2740184 RepID=A0A6V8MJC9_9BACT|nr:YkgJ family cysteine cluster protein [Geomonas silvestris]GFO60091.1 hypothetical protein GMST_24160 [Geomonas silvestris]